MYLRETKRTNSDGRTVSYLQLAHNHRDPKTGVPKAEMIHSFGRADRADREGLARLVRSISRFLEPGEAVAASIPGLAEVDEDSCYRAMDFLLECEEELAKAVYFSTAELLDLNVDLIFFDGSSTYWETDQEDPDQVDEDGEVVK
ncbi:MAG: hypothetical protein ACYDC5_11660, partial [Candidatus Dormibacteria bacterium]